MNFNFLDSGNIIYTLYFFFLIFFVLTKYRYSNKQNKSIFVVFILIQLFLGCFRMEGVGTDTFAYVRYMDYDHSLSYGEVFSERILTDPFFYLLLKFLYDPFQSYTFVFSVLQIVFWISFGCLVYRYSDKCLLTLLVFVFLKYHFNVWSAIRQGLAFSFLMWSYVFLMKEKKLPYLLCIGLASLAHSSAFLFIIAYPMRFMNLYKKKILLVVITSLIIAATPFLEILNSFNFDISGMLNEGSSSNLFILLTTIIAFLFISVNYRPDGDKSNNLLFNLSFVAFLMAILGFRVTLGYRMLIYFGIFIALLVGNVVVQKRWPVNKIIMFLIIPMIVMYIMTGIPSSVTPYHFVWEEKVYIDVDTKK